MIGREAKAEKGSVRLQVGWWCHQRGENRREWRERRYRKKSCREREGVSKDSDRNAGSRFRGHAQLAVLTATLRRQLLHKSVAGVGMARQAVLAAECGTS